MLKHLTGMYWFMSWYSDLGWKTLFWIRAKTWLGSIPRSSHTWTHTHANAHADLCRVCSLVVRSFSHNSFKMIQAAAASSTQPQWQGHVRSWRRMQATHLLPLMAFQLLRAERDGDPACLCHGAPGPYICDLGFEPFPLYNPFSSYCSSLREEQGMWNWFVQEVPCAGGPTAEYCCISAKQQTVNR